MIRRARLMETDVTKLLGSFNSDTEEDDLMGFSQDDESSGSGSREDNHRDGCSTSALVAHSNISSTTEAAPGPYRTAGAGVVLALVPPPLSLTLHQVYLGLNMGSLTQKMNGSSPRLRQRGMGAEWRACHLLPDP
ncbi:hypothetical protein D4764_14G0001880 [Takifugu flavidus]|uniref:Uncharacterized protein n=1 Tax=Takifugu flavidus TaxID=433684 RepID=A0A5C6P7N6_9TELE|nr:hypothetical protein D4764_14G0001880 [Takifugu flavidus]